MDSQYWGAFVDWARALNWGSLGDWAGALVAAFGFIFIWVQLKHERSALEAQTRLQIYELGSNVLNMFVERPELRPYFYSNRPIPTKDPLRSQVLAATELVLDQLESIVMSHGDMDATTLETWAKYMNGIYLTSPTIQEFLDEDHEGNRYDKKFRDLISGEGGVEALDERCRKGLIARLGRWIRRVR